MATKKQAAARARLAKSTRANANTKAGRAAKRTVATPQRRGAAGESVGWTGFEPATSPSSMERSVPLS